MVRAGSPYVLRLERGWWCVLLACRALFCCGRAGVDSTGAAVIADVVDRGVVDDGLVVDVGDVGIADVIHRAVIVEGSMVPISALIADATISVSIVNATVEADLRAPVAAIPGESAATPTPIARRPE